MINTNALISLVSAPMQTSIEYGSSLFFKFLFDFKRFLFTELFKHSYLKSIIANRGAETRGRWGGIYPLQ